MPSFARWLLDMLRLHMKAARSRRSRILTARTLDSLPASLRRDIGWPERHIGPVADEEWHTPIEVAPPPAGAVGPLRRRPARGIGATPAPASRKPVFGVVSPVRRPPVSS